MLFNSGEFLIFFPLIVMIYYLLPQKTKNGWLLIASYYFYMCWNAKYALLLFMSTFVTYIGGILIEKLKASNTSNNSCKSKKTILVIALLINLLILFGYKYTNFAIDTLNQLLASFKFELNIPTFDIILPVGISFYIFQALGYLIDVYRDEIYAEKNFFRYALFVSFFPQLVAGPIERSKNLLVQLATEKKANLKNWRDGLLIMLWGFFLKLVIADRCAILVNTVYADPNSYFGIQLIFANILFALQIYCDFMGYSTIAKGAALVLGIKLIDNFEQPYLATSIKDFWRRWHISLSTWFKDYVYIPLGGSRCSKIKKYRNLFLTFMISGLWHGANWTFVIWGAIHGVYQIVEDLLKLWTDKLINKYCINIKNFSWKFLMTAKTFFLVDIAWIFFRADSIQSAFIILKKSFNISNWGLIFNDSLYQLGLNTRNINILFVAILTLLAASCLKEKKINVLEWISQQHFLFRYLLYWSALLMIILSLDITGQEFIYFQF